MTPETCNSPDTEAQAENVALLPCPHCGSNNLHVYNFFVHCVECEADGPDLCRGATSPRRDEAIVAWNRRSAPALPADVKGLVDEWRKAMEGVTPGPWNTEQMQGLRVQRLYVVGPSTIVHPHDGICEPARLSDRSFKEDDANMRFIAHCSPESIEILLTVLSAQAALLAEFVAATKPFVLIANIEDSIGTKAGESIMVNVDLCRAASRLHHEMGGDRG